MKQFLKKSVSLFLLITKIKINMSNNLNIINELNEEILKDNGITPPLPTIETPPTSETPPPPKEQPKEVIGQNAPPKPPPIVEAPDSTSSGAAGTGEQPKQPISPEQARIYAEMYTEVINFGVSMGGGFLTGNDSRKYDAPKEQKERVTAGAFEYFKTSEWVITPLGYMLVTTLTVFGMIVFRIWMDYKANKIALQREQVKLQREQLAEAQRQREAQAAEAQRQREAQERQEQQQQQKPTETKPATKKDSHLYVVDKDVKEGEKIEKRSLEADSIQQPQPKTPPAIQVEEITKKEFENLREVIENRRNFVLLSTGEYKFKADREVYNKSEEIDRYKPSGFVKELIDQAAAQHEEQRKICLQVRTKLDALKKQYAILIHTPPKPKSKKHEFEH